MFTLRRDADAIVAAAIHAVQPNAATMASASLRNVNIIYHPTFRFYHSTSPCEYSTKFENIPIKKWLNCCIESVNSIIAAASLSAFSGPRGPAAPAYVEGNTLKWKEGGKFTCAKLRAMRRGATVRMQDMLVLEEMALSVSDAEASEWAD